MPKITLTLDKEMLDYLARLAYQKSSPRNEYQKWSRQDIIREILKKAMGKK